MPESKPRKKPAYTPPKNPMALTDNQMHRWWAPVMMALMVLGLLWIVTAYITQLAFPIPGIGPWNIAAGFGVALVGFAMVTRWR